MRLVQGSHIAVPRLFDHDRAYIFQNPDGRIVFAIPYERAYTLIGTTDRDFTGDSAAVVATTEEIAYLCDAVSFYFARPVVPADVVWSFSGVRPLYNDRAGAPDATTRDYVLELDAAPGGAALLSVFAARSPPTGASPRRLSTGWGRICRRKRGTAPAGPDMRRCRAAISPWMDSRRSRPRSRPNTRS